MKINKVVLICLLIRFIDIIILYLVSSFYSLRKMFFIFLYLFLYANRQREDKLFLMQTNGITFERSYKKKYLFQIFYDFFLYFHKKCLFFTILSPLFPKVLSQRF